MRFRLVVQEEQYGDTGRRGRGGEGRLVALSHRVIRWRLVILQALDYQLLGIHRPCSWTRSLGDTHDFRLLFVISFFSAAPSKGLSSSNEQSKSSETDMTAPKFCDISNHYPFTNAEPGSSDTHVEFSAIAI